MTPKALEALEGAILEEIPGFEVRYKDESKLMKALGFLVGPFNQRFMTDFVTTWGTKVYFPSRAFYAEGPDPVFVTLAHEFVHLCDSRSHGFRFQLSYAAPQVYALAILLPYSALASVWPLLAFVGMYVLACLLAKLSVALSWAIVGIAATTTFVLAVMLTGWVALLFLVGTALLGPWPSKGRTKWELRGYGMNMAIFSWLRGREVDGLVTKVIAGQFTGPSYWYMSRDGDEIQHELSEMGAKALSKSLAEVPYATVYQLLLDQGLVRHV